MPALANFLRDELPRRGWSVEEFSHRAEISVSLGYQIIRDGKDNVRQTTFDGIAEALNMTPAELKIVTGKGRVADDPARVPLHADIRAVPHEDLTSLRRVIRAFVRNDAKTRSSYPAKAHHDSQNTHSDDGPSQPSGGGTVALRRAARRLTTARNELVISAFASAPCGA